MSMIKNTALACVMLSATAASQLANAGASANFGFMSDYLFRGIYQTSSSAYTGLDYESGGAYVGTWLADVDDGIEYDLYGGYNWEFDSGFSLGVGAAGYFYTDEFDDTYTEASVTAGYKLVSLEFVSGTYDTDPDSADYTFSSITVGDSIYAKYGTFGSDFEGSYFELGYSKDVGDLSFTIALVVPDEDLDLRATASAQADAFLADPTISAADLAAVQDSDVYLTIDIGYTFDL